MDSQQQQNSGLPAQQQQTAQQPMPSQQTPPSPMSMPQQPQQFMFVPPPMVRHYPPRGQIPYAQGFVQPAMHAQVHGRGYPAGMVPIINMPPEFMGQIPRGYPVPGQQMMQPMPYPPPAAQQPHAAPVKRERKPLVIVDPRTNTEVELKPKAKPAQAATPTPAVAAAAAPSPGLGPVPVAPASGSNTPLQRPSAAEEMRSKALAAKSGASPSPSMATVTAKMETLRLDSAPMPQASVPQQVQRQAVPSQPAAAPVVKEQPTVHSAPPPLAVSVPAPSEPAVPTLSAEEKLARARREMEEKTQKMQAFEQKSKEIQATKEAKPQSASVPPPLNAAAGFGDEPKPQISLPVPTTALPTPSPTNKGERLVYSRDELLGLRNVDAAMKAPADLHSDFQDYQPRPRQPRPNVRREGAGGPPRVGSGGPPSFGGWAGKSGGGAQAAAGSQAPAVAPLKVSQNAWRRTAPTSEHEAALRTIRSILNRLAKDNFDVLSKEVLAMPITSLAMLQEIIEAIFDKALMEPPFGPVYAQLCKEISDKAGGEWDFVRAYEREGGWFWSSTVDVNQEGALNGPDPNNPAIGYTTEKEAMDAAKKQTGFKRILLNTCQAEFEKNSFEEVDEEEKQLRESMDMNTDEAKQKLQHVDAKRRKIKKRVLGNMAFIGELFLKKMLSAKIINTCVVGLLGDEAVSNPESYFDQDKKNEVPPEDIESLCKLFQTVGKEMDQGEYQKYIDRYFHFLSLLEQQLAKSSRPEQRTSRQRFMIKDLIDLRKARWVDKRETKVAGREEVRQRADQEAARSAQGGRGGPMATGGRNQPTSARFQQGAATTTSIPRVQQSSRFAQAATTTTRGPVIGGGAVRSTVPVIPSVAGRPAATPTPPPVSSTPPVAKKPNGSESISEDKLKTSYVSALEEFVVNGNAVDLASEFRSLFERFDPVKAKQILVSTMVDRIIEKKEEERQVLTKLLPALVEEHKVLSTKDVVDALKDSLEFLNDILIDAPKAAQHMAVLLSKCVEQNALTVGNVVEAMERLRESEDGPDKLIGELQKAMSADNMTKLNAALSGGGASESNGAAAGGAWVEKFSGLVRGGKSDNELVEFLASSPQNEVVSKGPELFDVVFEHVARKASAVQGPANEAQQESEKQAVSSVKNTLKRLVQNGSNQVEHQVKALQALNDLSKRNQHPQGFIRRMFENLYRNDIIIEDAFNAWRSKSSKEDAEQAEGFFQYLAKAQPESNDDN